MSELDRVLPEWHHRERHSIRVDAEPERVIRALRDLTLAEMPVVRLLVRLRGLQPDPARPVLDEALRRFRVLADDPGELVLGAIGRPWELRGWERTVWADFATFAEPGYAKMALNFRLDGQTLSTETRVLLTDAAARRSFRRYWVVIRPFSGLIRRLWLRAIKRRAERPA